MFKRGHALGFCALCQCLCTIAMGLVSCLYVFHTFGQSKNFLTHKALRET
jgi:hypothetical protein